MEMPRMTPSFKSTPPLQTNTTVATPEENTLIIRWFSSILSSSVPKTRAIADCSASGGELTCMNVKFVSG
jgi:hypothetical protein